MRYIEKYFDNLLNEGIVGGTLGAIIGSMVGRSFITRTLFASIGGAIGDWLGSYIKYSFAKSIDECRDLRERQLRDDCYEKVFKRSIKKLKEKLNDCDTADNPGLCRNKILTLISKLERHRNYLSGNK